MGSARGACAAAAALRGHARVVQARVRRGVPSGWGALASQEEPPSKFSNGRAKCRFKRRGEGYCSRTPGTNRKAVGLETCRVNPSHTNLLRYSSQILPPSSCVACTVFVGRHTREQATQTQWPLLGPRDTGCLFITMLSDHS